MQSWDRPSPDDYASDFAIYLAVAPADGSILDHLKAQGSEVLHLMRGLDVEAAERRYAPGKWSVKELIGHLIDTERVFIQRALWFARGGADTLPGMEEDVWAAAAGSHRRPLTDLWREYHVARIDHLYLLRSLPAEAVGRRGTAGGRVMSVRAVPWIIAGHERHHLQVLRERYGLSW